MLPPVSTGPMDPTWSPNGAWIAFSMRGDIWKVPVSGGEAIALTRGPAYHFEPAWSPDGRHIALSMDGGGNLDIGVVSADGGDVSRLTTHHGADVQPAWSNDSETIYFASARNGTFDIFRVTIDGTGVEPVIDGRGNQFQPSISPTGDRIAYVSPVPGRLGSGGIWRYDLTSGESQLVHYEETSYRATPRWTPDGAALVYASDAAGSYDLAIVPAEGGNRVRLTHEDLDEFAPSIQPDGSAIAFVSNAAGPTRLFTVPAGGGARASWQEVVITSRRSRMATGRLAIEVLGPDGQRTPARIQLVASDGRAYSPEDGFHRVSSANEIHYFHTSDTAVVEVPVGPVTVEATRGFEYIPASETIRVAGGETQRVTLRLQRLVDAPGMGWYSGDTHVHDLHEGRYGLTQGEFFYQHVADDLHVANALIHMDGTKIMGRWDDLTGEDHPLSNQSYILRYAQEFRGSYGHVGLLGVRRFVMPLIAGTSGTTYAADVLKTRYLDGVVAEGGIGGFMHPYLGDVESTDEAAQSDIPLHVALGKGQFFDMVSVASDELASAAMYYRMLNSGFRLTATGGTDNFGNVWRDPSGGTARTYALVDGALSWITWIDAVRQGNTFATNGPLLFVTINGMPPGSEMHTRGPGPDSLTVVVEGYSNAPVDRIEVVLNGSVAHTTRPVANQTRFAFSTSIQLTGPGWIAVRAVGNRHRHVGDHYAFAHTSPVYVVHDEERFIRSEDVEFLKGVIDEIWSRVERRDAWRSDSAKAEYLEQVNQAREALQRSLANPGS
jgi:hypothetical protein